MDVRLTDLPEAMPFVKRANRVPLQIFQANRKGELVSKAKTVREACASEAAPLMLRGQVEFTEPNVIGIPFERKSPQLH